MENWYEVKFKVFKFSLCRELDQGLYFIAIIDDGVQIIWRQKHDRAE